MNYTRLLTNISRAREPSAIRVITALLARSPASTISLAGGAPNPQTFPFKEADFTLRDGSKLTLDTKKMSVALQYGPSQGQPDLVEWLKALQKKIHNPPTFSRKPEEGGIDLCITPGCQDGLCKSFEMMVNPGDNVIIDCPTYSGTLAVLRPLGCNLLPVETDQHGMKPASLQDVLSRWSPSEAREGQSDAPKLLYIIPNGVNPTGSSMTDDRKKQIYKIAQEYDLLIMEDDPYYFLQFNKDPVQSFLSMDVDGRVLRFDSFSKIMSSGLRLGFVTGPQPLVERIILHMMVSSMHTSALSQVMVNELLHQWGIDGFRKHVDRVVEFYREQKNHMMNSANKWLKGLAEWHVPQAGMFFWFRLLGITDTKPLIEQKALKKQVMFVPGCAFMPDPTKPTPFVRASFSLATPEQIDQGLERLAILILDELRQKK